MTLAEQVIIVAAVVASTMATRFVPFLLFPPHRQTPRVVLYLGRILPPAVIGMLVVYSLKDVSLFTGSRGVPEMLSLLLLVFLQVWWRNILLTIAGSTIFYMLLVQYVFI